MYVDLSNFGFLLNTRGGVFEMEKSEDQQDGENVTIAPHFGDIMGKQTFTALPDGFMPIERIVLLANGNLQRVVSAFYNVSFFHECLMRCMIFINFQF